MGKIRDIKCIIGQDAGLANPSGLLFDREQNALYICDMQNSKVSKYNFNTGKLEDLSNVTNENKMLARPLAIAMDSSKRLVIADAGHNSIYVYERNMWNLLRGGPDSNINLPGSLTCGENYNVYFSDFLNDRIRVIDRNRKISEISEVNCGKPYGIFYRENYLYITDNGNNRLLCINTESRIVETLIADISPIAVTADDRGNIYVSETRRIFLYSRDKRESKLILDRDIFKKFGYGKLCHVGALAYLFGEKIVFSDTIKNCVYEMIIDKENKNSA